MQGGYLLVLVLWCTIWLGPCHGLAVMSVDLGTEWMKVGIVSPGVPMEIALNKESQRKTPAVISFRDGFRTFGEDAQNVALRHPTNSYMYLLDLLGKNISHPLVELYRKRFPYYDIVPDEERGTIRFRHDNDTYYSPEELVAQFLVKAKEMAELGARQPINECVLTVPGYFNQAERRVLLRAAQLANLKVLQLINDYVAVALNYGIFRVKDFNETAQYMMFYDMGASSTTATLVSYQMVKTKERGYVETHPQLSIVGVGFDRTLGGLEIQLRLRDYLAKKFNEMKKTTSDVFRNPRAMAKLFKEAGRVKTILSANAEHYAQVEGLLDEQDFKFLVKRDDLEALLVDFFERVKYPVEQALKTSHLTRDILSQVVLVGAGTRVPKVQEILQNTVGQDLAKNLNTDEAATMGAVYKAADLSTGFQVKKFITKDAVLYPIQIVFAREVDNSIKQVRRTLFGLMNPYPQKKIITFNKHTTDFGFNVNYAELDHLNSNEIENLGSPNLTEITLTGVEDALKKNTGDNVETKGIKSHFAMDESGVLNLLHVELVVEKTVSETDEEGTFSKLGNTISKLFGGEEKTTTEEPPVEKKTTEDKVEANSETKNETDQPQKNATVEEKPKDVKPKIVTLKEKIQSTEKVLMIDVMSDRQFKDSLDKLAKLDKIESDLNRRATALNNLESYVIDVRNKLDDELYSQSATKEEIEKILKSCNDVSEWLYEDGADADADTYESKLNALEKLTSELFARVWEHNRRPDALADLNQMLNHSTHFLTTAKNLTKDTNQEKPIFSDSEIDELERLINDTQTWKTKQIAEQKKLKRNDPIKLTIHSIVEKRAALEREMKYLVNKLKLWRPKKVEKPVVKEKEEEEEKAEKKEEQQEGKVDEQVVGEKPTETEQEGTVVDDKETNVEVEEQEEETIEDSTVEDVPEEIKPTESENSKDQHSEL